MLENYHQFRSINIECGGNFCYIDDDFNFGMDN